MTRSCVVTMIRRMKRLNASDRVSMHGTVTSCCPVCLVRFDGHTATIMMDMVALRALGPPGGSISVGSRVEARGTVHSRSTDGEVWVFFDNERSLYVKEEPLRKLRKKTHAQTEVTLAGIEETIEVLIERITELERYHQRGGLP